MLQPIQFGDRCEVFLFLELPLKLFVLLTFLLSFFNTATSSDCRLFGLFCILNKMECITLEVF